MSQKSKRKATGWVWQPGKKKSGHLWPSYFPYDRFTWKSWFQLTKAGGLAYHTKRYSHLSHQNIQLYFFDQDMRKLCTQVAPVARSVFEVEQLDGRRFQPKSWMLAEEWRDYIQQISGISTAGWQLDVHNASIIPWLPIALYGLNNKAKRWPFSTVNCQN